MTSKEDTETIQPPQTQSLPGDQDSMRPEPESIRRDYQAAGKLQGKKALITGGDSGIGRAVALHFAAEGADVYFDYLSEDDDARETCRLVEKLGRKCACVSGDVGDPEHALGLTEGAIDYLGGIDILVANAAEQHLRDNLQDISPDLFEKTFRTNVFGYFYVLQAAAPHLPDKTGNIILTTSVTAFRGSSHLIDYSATKGAIVSMTRSLAKNFADREIRVNSVAPGPVWTPLIPATFSSKEVAEFGRQTPFDRPAQPSEVAPAYVFLASKDASYITGHTLHVNGGDFVSS